jgi:hypothetical protein
MSAEIRSVGVCAREIEALQPELAARETEVNGTSYRLTCHQRDTGCPNRGAKLSLGRFPRVRSTSKVEGRAGRDHLVHGHCRHGQG